MERRRPRAADIIPAQPHSKAGGALALAGAGIDNQSQFITGDGVRRQRFFAGVGGTMTR